MIFKKLAPEFDALLKAFDSGNSYLDQFLKGRMAYDGSIGKTYLFLSDDKKYIIGYYNIGVGSVEIIEDDMRKKIGGAIHINCFAIDKKYQDQVEFTMPDGENIHLSDLMLFDCMNRIKNLRENHIGVAFVTLNATKEGEYFYKHNDFEYLESDMDFSLEDNDVECIKMYLPLDIE